MAAKTPEMNTDFARWYAQEFMDEGAVRDARWKSVVAIATGADESRIEVLIRLAFGAKDPGGYKNEQLAKAYTGVVDAIRSADQDFDASRAARELQVLAAASLVRLFASSADAALTVTTASFGGSRTPQLPMDLAGLAGRALLTLTSKHHERPELNALEVEAPGVDYESERENSEGEALTPSQELDSLRDATDSAIQKLVERQNEVIAVLARRMELGEEELQMMWWLVGAYSRTLDQPFSKMTGAVMPIVLAYELGEMTTVSPGPATARAILAKAGVGTKRLALRDAVNAVDPAWGREVGSAGSVSPITTPIHFALEKRAEVSEDEAWQASWAALTGLPVDVALPAVQLAELFYREHLFLHVAG